MRCTTADENSNATFTLLPPPPPPPPRALFTANRGGASCSSSATNVLPIDDGGNDAMEGVANTREVAEPPPARPHLVVEKQHTGEGSVPQLAPLQGPPPSDCYGHQMQTREVCTPSGQVFCMAREGSSSFALPSHVDKHYEKSSNRNHHHPGAISEEKERVGSGPVVVGPQEKEQTEDRRGSGAGEEAEITRRAHISGAASNRILLCGAPLGSPKAATAEKASGQPLFSQVDRAASEGPLFVEPPTPAKQRRTIHSISSSGGGPHLSAFPISPSLAYGANPRWGPPSRIGASATSGLPSSTNFKYMRGEYSRKRSADVLSQFSALDLDDTPATPFVGDSNRLVAFPSQPPPPPTSVCGRGGLFGPSSPLVGGYATPVAVSQQIGVQANCSQMLLYPSQDALDYSQADTDCSTFLARRIVSDYNEVQLLGRGSFGTVSLYEEVSSGEYVAVKVSPPLRAPDMERRYRRERTIMGLARGMPHIVQLSAAWEEGRIPKMYLQLEYCPGGSLAAVAAEKQAKQLLWAESEVMVFLSHMAIALDALHRANIAHVDFKPENVLIDRYGGYKLSDFGCSILLDSQGRPRPETRNGYSSVSCVRGGRAVGDMRGGDMDSLWEDSADANAVSVDEGDCRYLCADMLNEKQHFKAGDMFSLGMSLYELLSGEPLPRNGDRFLSLRQKIPTEKLLRRGYSSDLVQLVVALTHAVPEKRPTARQVLQFLRPPPPVLQVLGDRQAMGRCTADSASNEEQLPSVVQTSATPVPLRCFSALVEASAWLLSTQVQDVYLKCGGTDASTAIAEQRGAHERSKLLAECGQHSSPTAPVGMCTPTEVKF